MQRFKNILYIEETPEANPYYLRRVFDLAKENGAKLTVSSVLDESLMSIPSTAALLKKAKAPQTLVSAMKKILKERLVPFEKEHGVRTQSMILSGIPCIEIIKNIHKNKYDLVIIASDHRATLREHVFGNTISRLIRKAPCPVWVLKPRRKKFHKIVAAVDPFCVDTKKQSLNHDILQIAISLARLEGSEVDVVHCWQEPLETLYSYSQHFSAAKMKEIAVEARLEHKQALDALLSTCDSSNVKMNIKLLKGDAGYMIPKYLKRCNSDVLVMGSVCRSGVEGFLIGNTAERVVHDVTTSILAIKPKGFKSPVN